MIYKAYVKYLFNNTFEGGADNLESIKSQFGDENRKYMSPIQLLPVSFAGCTAIDILTILKK